MWQEIFHLACDTKVRTKNKISPLYPSKYIHNAVQN